MTTPLSHRVAVYTGTFDPVHRGHLDIDATNGGQSTAVRTRGDDTNVAHVTDVKNANASANRFMFGD